MATANEYIEKAASYIGISGTDNIFNTWYWGFHCYNPNVYPWCAAFQSYVGVHDLDMPFGASASAAGVANQGERIPDSEARAGDWVLFNWDGRQEFGWADHIGVVEWSDINGSGYFGCIEGNTGGGEGEVMRTTRYNWGSYATAFYRPPFGASAQVDTVKQVAGSAANNAGLSYRAHCANVGWLPAVHDGQVAGTTGYGVRLEAFKITPPEGWELTVRVHVQDVGNMEFSGIKRGENSGTGSSANDPIIGTVGKSQRIEAVSISVDKRPAGDNRKLYFRVHQATVGWKAWTEEGFTSGSDGLEIQLEAIQMKIE